MRKILISFLGTGGGKTTTGHASYEYRQSCYRWYDGTLTNKQPFFGFALQEKIRAHQLLIFGTQSSMWPTILYHAATLYQTDQYNRLFEQLSTNHGKPEIAPFIPELAQALTGLYKVKINLELVTPCTERQEMVQLFSQLVNFLKNQKPLDELELHLDITHSFRHIPLIALNALSYITTFYPRVRVGGIYYAIFELKEHPQDEDEPTQIVNLSPTWEMLQWYHAARDYLVYGKGNDLVSLVKTIDSRTAQLLENVNDSLHLSVVYNLSHKFDELNRALTKLPRSEKTLMLNPMIPELQAMCATIKPEYPEWQNQIYIARWYYQKKMYQQAVTVLVEAINTFVLLYHHLDPHSHAARRVLSEKDDKRIEKALDDPEIRQINREAKDLRNYFNHAGMTKLQMSPFLIQQFRKSGTSTQSYPALKTNHPIGRLEFLFAKKRIERLINYFTKRLNQQSNAAQGNGN